MTKQSPGSMLLHGLVSLSLTPKSVLVVRGNRQQLYDSRKEQVQHPDSRSWILAVPFWGPFENSEFSE